MGAYQRIKHKIPWDLRFRLNHILLDSPRIGSVYMSVRKSAFEHARAQPCTGLLVDGFPRSANTFVYLMLRDIFEPELTVKGHGHSASAIIESVRMGVPTLLLLRNPRHCVPSLTQLAPGVRLTTAFAAYSRFHEALLPDSRDIYVADFNDVIADPAALVEGITARFALPERQFIYDEATKSHIDNLVLEDNKKRHGGRLSERGLARPSAKRLSATEVLEQANERGLASAMRRADDAYQEMRRAIRA